jgi:putative DNA primase/helicase
MMVDKVKKSVDDLLADAQSATFAHVDVQSQFRVTKEGNATASMYNTMLALSDAPWRGVIAYDEFAHRIVKRKTPPTRVVRLGEWSDLDDVQALLWISETFSFEPKKDILMGAVLQTAHQNTFHPVREWLRGLTWAGTPRLAGLLAKHFGALPPLGSAPLGIEDQRSRVKLGFYLKLVSVRWLVGAVARIMEPGCKVDTMVTLEGAQGAYKSSSLRELFGKDWFADSKLNLGDKDALANMQGKWAYEMAEMDAHRKADDTAFKLFLSSQIDRVRWHYGKRAEDVPRQCIFVGTTNMEQYGKDDTGMRRIWPVRVGKILRDEIRADRDQLWAEAVHLFDKGVRWWVDREVVVIDPEKNEQLAQLFTSPVTEWELFEEQASDRAMEDAWQHPVVEWLEQYNAVKEVSTATIMGEALKLDRARWTQMEQKRVASIMRGLGWESQQRGTRYKRHRVWVLPEALGEVLPGASQISGVDDADLPI